MKTDLHWKRIGLFPHHGICLPLSALRSKKSWGIGEFFDLLPLIDWCKSLKLDCIQLLPLNDTGSDPSPYNASSSIALDPVYLTLSTLPHSVSLPIDFSSLTQMQRVDKIEVRNRKLEWLEHYFQKNFPEISKTDSYQTFIQENSWLQTYAEFKVLKEIHGGKHWQDWPSKKGPIDPKRIHVHSFIQYLCFQQIGKVREYASEQKVYLKGDIPILLSPDSADVWGHPSLFRLDLSAGAPPDAYNPRGQNWGFPLFNWEAMRQDGFRWWKERLKAAGCCFHIYRIDHVVGFFRIWAIEKGKKAADGNFIPSDHHLWEPQGRELLEMLIATSPLLPIAEDLGTIPNEVFVVLKEFGICGTKILRWQRQGSTYILYNEYEPFSLTTVSTPDMDTLELWWKKFPSESVPFAHFKHWSYHPILKPKQRLEILRDAHHTPSYFHINLLQEYLALFPELVWPNLEDERINIPGTVLPTNWTFRFRPYLEEIIDHKPLREAFEQIL